MLFSLRELMDTSSRKGLIFSPFSYLLIMSKQLIRSLNGCTVRITPYFSPSVLFSTTKFSMVSVVSRGSTSYHERSLQEKKEDIQEVNDFINANVGKSVMVFSDGSVYDGLVGCGACAAVLIPQGDDVVITESKAVGKKIDSVSCELEGILLGLRLIVEYFNSADCRRSKESVYFFSDCVFSIESVVKRTSVREHYEIFERLIALEAELLQNNIDVSFAWIPGHSGIKHNDLADSLAKDTAHDIQTGRLAASTFVSYADVVRMSKEIAKNSWQTKWNHEYSGSYTRQLIPVVGKRLLFPEDRDIGISYCRLLLHDTMLMEDAYRTGLSETPTCECGLDRESAEHFLLCCARYWEARKQLTDSVNFILDSPKCINQYQISDTLLLSQDNGLTRKQDSYIKDALFQFITDTQRKL